jgi:3',5'-cyclic AMP phosphodiesterase CpdA
MRTLATAWLKRQMRLSITIRKSGYSLLNAFRSGLKIGLPFSALLAAIIPVLGMSWYFDTENWASGVWDGYAASRTEAWREAMINASGEKIDANAFRLRPKGLTDTTDFSFVVIGDPGEGDASQLVLKDEILTVTNKPDVKFVVLSSDIVYPSGAMHDYERKFFLPFKGVTKPIYAIPGNHDWYDALDAFVATFFTPEAAKVAIEARVRKDLKLTTTTNEVIKKIINQASYLRKEYEIPVGYQDAPFFQVVNDYFLLLTIDTGVLRRVDAKQLAWIKSVLEASKGKFVMALLGHPFYAIGEYQGNMNPDFKALHDLLRSYKVPLVMAGDTHDLEYYKELPQNGDGHTMYHFVNGGGGAYLSIGAAMAPADSRPTKDWAIYPSRGPIIKKIDSLTSDLKYPAWMWLKKYNGYPFSAEWLSAAFDYNQAPYFQSFMEIEVERSKNRIRLIPYGIHGQLRWSDLEYGGEGKPLSANKNGLAQWVVPLR